MGKSCRNSASKASRRALFIFVKTPKQPFDIYYFFWTHSLLNGQDYENQKESGTSNQSLLY